MSPPEIKLIILDWAGTTIDFGCQAPVSAFVYAFHKRGVAVSSSEARGPMGMHKRDHLRALLQMESVASRWRQVFGREWNDADIEELYRDVTELQLAAIGRHGELTPGVLQCVAEFRARDIKIASTTGYFRAAAAAVQELARQQGYQPDITIGADEVPAGRPAPWMIFRCMEALGVYPPSAVVKVGDTVIDIEDGRNAGCWSIGVVDSSNEIGLSEEEFRALAQDDRSHLRARAAHRLSCAGAHAVVNTLDELPGLIGKLNERLRLGERP